MMATIRKGTMSDIETASVLWSGMVEELAPEYRPSVKAWRDLACRCMASGSYHLWIAETDGIPVAFLDAFLFLEPSTGKFHLTGQHFYAIPEVRNEGVAPRLYRAAVDMAKALGVDTLELMCFPGQRDMWESLGFEAVRTMMRKEIGGGYANV